jgi:ABC-type polysaccharide/polyol phosphate export permease
MRCLSALIFLNFRSSQTMSSLFKAGFADLNEGIRKWRLWHLIGVGEMRRKYARSRLGQFWLTLSTAFSIGIMAIVWSILFKVPLADMLPHLAVSIIVWQYIAGIMSDATSLFQANNHLLLSQRVVCSIVVYSSVYRNLLVLLHNLAIIPIIFLIFRIPVTTQILLLFPGIILLSITSVWIAYVSGALCARYRDLGNALGSLMQLAFYVTPVIWKPGFVTAEHEWLIKLNPFSYFLNIIRGPLLGESFSPFDWTMALIVTAAGLLLSTYFIGSVRRRILYWI